MAPSVSFPQALIVGLIALSALLYGPISRTLTVFGVFREPSNTVVAPGDLKVIDDTTYCEDLHYYAPGNTLFAACEDNEETRYSYFPGLAFFKAPAFNQGSFHVIDPKTMKSKRLTFENFDSPFITHGIDVIADPAPRVRDAVYIFAVNHLPNPEWVQAVTNNRPHSKYMPKARSQIELFHHVLGTSKVRHVRSIRHPLIKTPNDILATDPYSFYVTNDAHYREGQLRELEHVMGRWSNTIHVHTMFLDADDPEDGVKATVALKGLRNNNGLGRGRNESEIQIASAAGGFFYLGHLSNDPEDPSIKLADYIPLDSGLDNPSYFKDPYPKVSHDASGYVHAGLSTPLKFSKTIKNPSAKHGVMVWHVSPGSSTGKWNKRLLFEDNGDRISTASAAVIVPIDPKKEGGKKKGWLFVTGFVSKNMIAVKVDL